MNRRIENKILTEIAAERQNSRDAAWIKQNISAGIDWSFLILYAIDEGLISFLYCYCRNQDLLDALPDWVGDELYYSYRQTIFHNTILLHFLEKFGEHLRSRKLAAVVLKGASLLNSVYTDIGLRPMEDIDLMVRPGDLIALQQILEKMGFEQDQLYPTTFKKGIIHVDLHTDFLSAHRIRSRQGLTKIDLEEVWDRAVPFMEAEIPLFRLALYDNLIFLCFHLLKHNFSRLIWFLDIKKTIEQSNQDFDWLDFAAFSRKVSAERVMLYVILLTKHILGLRVPDDALKRFGIKHLSTTEKQILRIRLANEPMGRLAQLLYLFQMRKISQKLRFIWENIFPQKEVMEQIFQPATRRLSPDLYILRGLNIFLNGMIDVFLGTRALLKGSLPRI